MSMQSRLSKYWPVQCASPVVSLAMRVTHASYATANLVHVGLHCSSSSGLWSTGSSSSDLLRRGSGRSGVAGARRSSAAAV